MLQITFITCEGTQTVAASAADTLMEAAVANDVGGINGDCGGVCSCATCHVRVAKEWVDRVGPPGKDESEMLAFYSGATGESRLSCQVQLSEALDGLVVEVVPLD
jgi:2Fe-2S ferredoxin